jgi:uncharacterized protein YbaA (DUF1428 family)
MAMINGAADAHAGAFDGQRMIYGGFATVLDA